MDILTLVLALFAGVAFLNALDQRGRIELLRRHLSPYRIDEMLAILARGYERALEEEDPERRQQIWSMLAAAERDFAERFNEFMHYFVNNAPPTALVSTLPIALPWANRWCRRATFDLRTAFMMHAYTISEAVDNKAKRSPRDRAFTVLAELLLMQHTCHWFCRSFRTASARLRGHHKTRYEQVLASVAPYTRSAYSKVTGR